MDFGNPAGTLLSVLHRSDAGMPGLDAFPNSTLSSYTKFPILERAELTHMREVVAFSRLRHGHGRIVEIKTAGDNGSHHFWAENCSQTDYIRMIFHINTPLWRQNR